MSTWDELNKSVGGEKVNIPSSWDEANDEAKRMAQQNAETRTEVIDAPTDTTNETGVFDKAVSFMGKIAKGVGNWLNKQQQENAERDLEMREMMTGDATFTKDPTTGKRVISSPQIDAYKNAKTPEEKAKIIKESEQEIPLIKFLNSKTGQAITGKTEIFSNVPLKTWARLKAFGDDTYDEAYASLLEDRQKKIDDPETSYFTKIRYQVEDSGVQTALGILLGLGVSAATRGKVKPQVVTTPYFAAISAEGQRQERGQVESLGNIAIDTVGDTVLSGIADAALKSFLKEGSEAALKALFKKTATGFGVEGSTEVTQSLLKYSNDYRNAKTEEEKQKVADALAAYIKEGGIVDEFLVGGISGGIITGAAAGIGMVGNKETKTGKGDTLVGDFNKDFSAIREEVKTLEIAIQENPNDTQSVERLTSLQDQLNDYQLAVKERAVYVSDQTQDNPLVTIETVKYPDGTFSYSFLVGAQGNTIQAPFQVSGTFKSQEQAVKAAKEEITEWVKAKLPTASKTEAIKLQKIQSKINETQDVKSADTEVSTKTVKTKEKSIVAVKKTKGAEKINAGFFKVTQYSKKGEIQGKAEAKFARSKKTGKTYLEISKDGERIERISLEQAKKKYKTTDRKTISERAVNGKFNKKTGQWDMRQSNAPVIKNTTQNQAEKKPVKTKGEVKRSKAFQRVQDRLGEYADFDVNYNRLNLADDTAKALEFIEKFPKEAKRIALGMQGAPEGVTETAISIALAEQATENNDFALAAQLERSRSLRQTRRGQEIVSERGRFNENSPHFFIQQVLAARLARAGKTTFKFLSKQRGDRQATGVQAKLKEGAEGAKTTVKKKLSATDLAQNVIDQLTC